MEYKEVSAKQEGDIILAEDINQIISNIEALKGASPQESPVSSIKELKEKIDNLGNTENIETASRVGFDNEKTSLNFGGGYDFPPIKNELKERYEIKVIEETYIQDDIALEENENTQTLILEKDKDKYVLHGSLNYNNESEYTSSINFLIISIDGNNDLGYIQGEMSQFMALQKTYKNKEDDGFKYCFDLYLFLTGLMIEKEDDLRFEVKEYSFNINIDLYDIKNKNVFLPVYSNNAIASTLELKNIDGFATLEGDLKAPSSDPTLLLFNGFILENYFNIENEENDAYYIDALDNITASKDIKYYIRKEILDGVNYSTSLANINITIYYLEMKHTNGSALDYNENIVFNLKAHKNAEVKKLEEEANIQKAIEILAGADLEANKLKKVSSLTIEGVKCAIYDLYIYGKLHMQTPFLIAALFPQDINAICLIDISLSVMQGEAQSCIYDFSALGLKNIKMHSGFLGEVFCFCIYFLAETDEELENIEALSESINEEDNICFGKITFIAKDGLDGFNIMTSKVKEAYEYLERLRQ